MSKVSLYTYIEPAVYSYSDHRSTVGIKQGCEAGVALGVASEETLMREDVANCKRAGIVKS
jgi:hypothetical protein